MNYFIFDFNKHAHFIDSFLNTASLAHKKPVKSEEWFLWKFRNNSFGESILACVEVDNNLIGCVALGMQDFIIKDKIIKGALSFETFVHPDFHGQGIFSKLIVNAEKEAISRGVAVLLNFPNSNSLKGFINKKWTHLDIAEYRIKPRLTKNFLFSFFHIKKEFKLSSTPTKLLALPEEYKMSTSDILKCNLTLDYFKWRFQLKKKYGISFY